MDEMTVPATPDAPDEPAAVVAQQVPFMELEGDSTLRLRALLRGDLRQVVPLAEKLGQFMRARRQLRACTHVGRYVRVQGHVFVYNQGTISIGERTNILGTAVRCEFVAYSGAVLEIGERTFINYGVSISAHQEVRIGARGLIGNYTNILDNSYHDIVDHQKTPRSRPVIIGDDVWIGAHAIILPGVSIGDGACVGAGAVVRESVPPRAIVIGNPARIVSFVDESRRS
jgi:maltose O-acetyltransferase